MTGSEEWKVFRETLSRENIFDDEASGESKEEEEEEERAIVLTVVVVITGPMSDVKCLVFSPVSIEVSESRDQSRETVSPPSPVGKPVLTAVVGRLVVDLGEGGEHEARDDSGEGSDGQGREA